MNAPIGISSYHNSITWFPNVFTDAECAILCREPPIERTKRTHNVYERMMEAIDTANIINYQCAIGHLTFDSMRYTVSGTSMRTHCPPTTNKLVAIAQLSKPSTYWGGRLEVAGHRQWGECGSVVVFPAYIPYRVYPVYRGKRSLLTAVIQGMQWS